MKFSAQNIFLCLCTGQLFNVQVPNGGTFSVRCPKEKRSGDSIVLRLPEFPDAETIQQQAVNDDSNLVLPTPPYQPSPEFTSRLQAIDMGAVQVPSDFICSITQVWGGAQGLFVFYENQTQQSI
jgi:hypothetical protein